MNRVQSHIKGIHTLQGFNIHLSDSTRINFLDSDILDKLKNLLYLGVNNDEKMHY